MLRISALPRLRSGNGQRTISTQALQLFLKHAKASEGALASVAAAPLQVKWRRGLETQELSLSAGWKPIELLKTAKGEGVGRGGDSPLCTGLLRLYSTPFPGPPSLSLLTTHVQLRRQTHMWPCE